MLRRTSWFLEDKLLSGKTVAFTGTLSMPRAQAKAMAERSGAKVTKALGLSTNVLVVGAKAGSKLGKAAARGVEQWTEAEFFRRLSAEEHKGRLDDNKGKVVAPAKGAFQFSLAWDAFVDLDAHLYLPNGTEVFYRNKSSNGCTLDVDRRPGHPEPPTLSSANNWIVPPVENLICPKVELNGRYKVSVWVYNMARLSAAEKKKPIPFTVHYKLGDDIEDVVSGVFRDVKENNAQFNLAEKRVVEFDVATAGDMRLVKRMKNEFVDDDEIKDPKPRAAKKPAAKKTKVTTA